MAVVAIAQRKLCTFKWSQIHVASQQQVPEKFQVLAEVPHEFLCPISLQPMTGPVFLLDGGSADLEPWRAHVYDHSSICSWIEQGGACDPATGVKLPQAIILRPHLTLQREIAAWCHQHHVSCNPKQWTKDPETSKGRTNFLQRLGKLLLSETPHHPFQS